MPFSDSRCVSDMSAHLQKPRLDGIEAYRTHSTRSQWESADPLGTGSDLFDPRLEVTPICSTAAVELDSSIVRVGLGFFFFGGAKEIDGVSMGTKTDCRGRNVESGWGQIRPGTRVTTGIYDGIKGLISEGGSRGPRPALTET